MDNKERHFWTKEKILKYLAYLSVGLFLSIVATAIIALFIQIPILFVVIVIAVAGAWGVVYLAENS